MIKVWAIQQISTGNYLPFYPSTRGSSFSEPTSIARPRLFYSFKSAKGALAAWLRGYHVPRKNNDDFGLFTIGYKIEKVPHRLASDMRIVEFELVKKSEV